MKNKIFEVGGCIRDSILGVHTNDIDFTFVVDDITKSVEEGFTEMTDWLNDNNFKIFLSTPEMFTIRAKFPNGHAHAGLTADFVMARKELGYMSNSRRPILVLGTIEDDLARRDFTLNALAKDINGNIIDLFGGIEDLHKGILKTPLDPVKTMLDDPLRVLRALRFSVTKKFTIEKNTWDAMFTDDVIDKLVETVSGERIRNELEKMFKHDTIATINLFNTIDVFGNRPETFLEKILPDGLWLLPTFKK
jgi:tRNA nucleotidyltransferase/poly(A) polymerase